MKKNWVLRLGLLAMVLTLVTMPMVSSTYAKYVTETSGTDTARVARWGVTLTSDVTPLFGYAYQGSSDAISTAAYVTSPDYTAITVNADSASAMVFAPGTEGSFTFTIQGSSEVALELDVDATITLSNDWKVAGAAYEPITFTFKNGTQYYNPITGQFDNGNTAVNMTATQLQTALKKLDSIDGTPVSIDANTNLVTALPSYDSGAAGATGVYVVDWVWPFKWDDLTDNIAWTDMVTAVKALDDVADNATDLTVYDYADTALGKAANGTTPSLSITLTITATQIN